MCGPADSATMVVLHKMWNLALWIDDWKKTELYSACTVNLQLIQISDVLNASRIK